MSYGMDGWCKEISTQPYKGKLTDHIKREDAIKALCKSKCHPGVLCPDEYCVEVREVFDNIPAAQPEIVRCKDCKHRYIDGENVRYNVCDLNHNKVQGDYWYCADGERKDD